MPTRRQTKSKPPFIVAFAGNGDVEQKNVDALLDNFFPDGDHVQVKDLCKALDDLEFDDDQAVPEEEQQDQEPPAATKTRGKPRGGTTQANDTNVPTNTTVSTFGEALEAIIRDIVREELNPEKATISALVNDDGEYKLGGKGRPSKGWTAVKLTPTEAREAGLEVPESD